MNKNECEFCELVNVNEDEWFLGETKYWKIYLANEQNYPGRCIIPAKRHCNSLAELTGDEWADFHAVVKVMENVLTKVLGATNVNWTCLMNGGYAVTPPNPHTHFHLIPRYDKEVKVGGQLFVDTNFANHYHVGNTWRVNYDGRKILMTKLKPAIQKAISELV